MHQDQTYTRSPVKVTSTLAVRRSCHALQLVDTIAYHPYSTANVSALKKYEVYVKIRDFNIYFKMLTNCDARMLQMCLSNRCGAHAVSNVTST